MCEPWAEIGRAEKAGKEEFCYGEQVTGCGLWPRSLQGWRWRRSCNENSTRKGKRLPMDTSYFTTEFGANPAYFTFLNIPGPLRKNKIKWEVGWAWPLVPNWLGFAWRDGSMENMRRLGLSSRVFGELNPWKKEPWGKNQRNKWILKAYLQIWKI